MSPPQPADRARLRLSVIVPFHKDLAKLARCLEGLCRARATLPDSVELAETIVAADGPVEDPAPISKQCGARIIHIDGPRGPAAARTLAAETAIGDVLVFVDSDVVVRETALERLAAIFLADPALGAAFGAYDEEPADRGFFSQCKNLAHSFIHQRSSREASTFWAGLGAVRARVFFEVGGFDPRFDHPSVEDIDLGYRIRSAGYRIVLDPAVQGTHLKRWTFWSSLVTDVRDRGVPWTQLLNRYRSMQNDLNLTHKYRLAVVLSYGLVFSLAAAVWSPLWLAAAVTLMLGLWVLDRPYYGFFARRRGLRFALAWFPFHILHHLCNGLSFALGTGLYLGRRWAGVALPWTLPVTPWPPPELR